MKYFFNLNVFFFCAFQAYSQLDTLVPQTIQSNQQIFQLEEESWGIAHSKPETVYHPYYNGMRMVEVDYYNSALRQGSYENAVHPRGGSSYYDALTWPARNAYYFIDSNDIIVKGFGAVNQANGEKFETDSGAISITHSARFSQGKTINDGQFMQVRQVTYGTEFGEFYTVYENSDDGIGNVLGTKLGLIDTLGNVKIPIVYRYIQWVDSSYLVQDSVGKWGLYNSNFEMKIPPHFRKLIKINQDLFVACQQKCGCINGRMEVVVGFDYDDIELFNPYSLKYRYQNNLALQRYPYSNPYLKFQNSWKYGIMDNRGEKVTPAKYTNIELSGNGFYVMDSLKKISIFDKQGQQLTPFKYEFGNLSLQESGVYKVATRDGWAPAFKYGFVDTLGNELGEIKYDKVYDYNRESVMVSLDKKFGLLNFEGKEITELKYDYMHWIWEQFYQVKVGKLYGLVDATGKEIVPPIYDHITQQDSSFIKFFGGAKTVLIPIEK
ncbi:MAG: hypothetical protein ACJA1C_003016 [Crocinitomicaceae bacterium]|jgi:uncharacterized protein YnzC (UPF0291/DUF896 family)